jgi:hypothetical protein
MVIGKNHYLVFFWSEFPLKMEFFIEKEIISRRNKVLKTEEKKISHEGTCHFNSLPLIIPPQNSQKKKYQ